MYVATVQAQAPSRKAEFASVGVGCPRVSLGGNEENGLRLARRVFGRLRGNRGVRRAFRERPKIGGITFVIARSGVRRYRDGGAAAVLEVNDAGRHLVVNRILIRSHEARGQNRDRYYQQGESAFVHELFLSVDPYLYLS